MAVPDFQTIMLPLLKFASDGQEHSIQDAHNHLVQHFNLTSDEVGDLLPSGQQSTFYNRVGWARTYLKKSGLLNTTRRAYFQITERGRQVIAEKPNRVDMVYLRRFPEYQAFKTASHKLDEESILVTSTEVDQRTPEEALEAAYQEIRSNLAQELLAQVQNGSSEFFEKLVVELLVAMGYGGSRRDAARAVGQAGDEGIDGIIDEDRLGLDTIYIQAKKWHDTVTRPEIQKFVGALQGKRARKGIFITTSSFSQGAHEYVSMIDTKVVLIDGKRLTGYMIDYNVGVSTVSRYELKRIDSDYFNGE